MKLLFVPAKSRLKIQIPSSQIKSLPKNIGLITTIQFINSLKNIKTQLEEQDKKVFISKSKQLEQGQILGCDIEAATSIKNKVDAFLYIGSGVFHPLPVAIATNKPVFCFNPEAKILNKLDEKQIQKAKALKRGQKIKFMSADKLGILVSTKPGQNKLKQAQLLQEKLKKKGKQAYIFMFDTFDENQLENWPEIQCWINTACPGLSIEQPKLAWIGDVEF